MSPRIKLRAAATPLVMAGALWATSALTPFALGGGAQTPPPCGPDGVCSPRPETFGWYQTRWRTFPGDVAFKAPTPAPGAGGPEPENLGGPQLPTPAQEGLLGPARQPREGAAGGAAPGAGAEPTEEDAAGAGLGGLPGEAPLSGFELPGAAPAPGGAQPPASDAEGGAPEGGPDTGPMPDPAAQPGTDPLDPFGAAPPAPPSWISRSVIGSAALNESAHQSLPIIEQPAAAAVDLNAAIQSPRGEVQHSIFMPAAIDNAPMEAALIENFEPGPQLPPLDGPNLHGDDAPPVLPPSLLGGVAGAQPWAAAATAPPTLRQPASVQPVVDAPMVDTRVTAASAESPLGIQLINPAAALVDPSAQGLQQAIYFEASDK
jgi:hypothetical protein